jgi:hypothetical protein
MVPSLYLDHLESEKIIIITDQQAIRCREKINVEGAEGILYEHGTVIGQGAQGKIPVLRIFLERGTI